MMRSLILRPVLDSDGPTVQSIMAKCFLQFPGCLYDSKENEDVLRPASSFAKRRGIYLVLQNDKGFVVAGAGIKAVDPEDSLSQIANWEFSRFYVMPDLQGQGAGETLFSALRAFGEKAGGGGFVAWSDTRFDRAHRFYQRMGMRQLPGRRALHDISNSQEYAFVADS